MVHTDLLGSFDPIRYNNETNFITKGIDSSTTNYLSEVGVGALAGVLAIALSVTLMAVQFSSQEYSPMIVKYFIRSSTFWSMILIYIPTILFNILLLNYINVPIEPFNHKWVDTSILLTMLCFLLLIPFFYFSLSELQPGYIFKNILRQVDKKFIKTNRDKELPLPRDSDPLSPFIENIEESIKSKDRSLIMIGLKEMHEYYNDLSARENDKFISEYFKTHFSTIANSAIQNSDEESIKRIVDIFLEIAQQNPDKTSSWIFELGSILAGQQKIQADKVVEIKQLLEVLQNYPEPDTIGITDIGLMAAKNKQKGIVIEAVGTLIDIAKNEIDQNVTSAMRIIVAATDHKLNVTPASRRVGNHIGKVITRDKESIDDLEKEDMWKIKLRKQPHIIIAEVESCWIQTIMGYDKEKLNSTYCEKSLKGSDELSVCKVTQSCLTTAINQIEGGKYKLKKPIKPTENGLCKLTFEQTLNSA
jgi:hypothetical protein